MITDTVSLGRLGTHPFEIATRVLDIVRNVMTAYPESSAEDMQVVIGEDGRPSLSFKRFETAGEASEAERRRMKIHEEVKSDLT
jgi:hypothetical protein